MKKFFAFVLVAMTVFPAMAFSQDKQTRVIAHRGYWNCEQGGFAHNSLASLKAAHEAGVWGCEFDVNMTSDEVLLVYHDSSIKGKRIDRHPYFDFADVRLSNGEAIPTLDDYLKAASACPDMVLVLELKGHSSEELENRAADLCIARLKEYGLFEPERVMFISFSLNACRHFVRKANGFTVQYLGGDKNPYELAGYGITGIDTNFNTLMANKKWLRMARKQRMSVNTWTVNSEKDIRRMLGLGVDYITTDEPALALELVSGRR